MANLPILIVNNVGYSPGDIAASLPLPFSMGGTIRAGQDGDIMAALAIPFGMSGSLTNFNASADLAIPFGVSGTLGYADTPITAVIGTDIMSSSITATLYQGAMGVLPLEFTLSGAGKVAATASISLLIDFSIAGVAQSGYTTGEGSLALQIEIEGAAKATYVARKNVLDLELTLQGNARVGVLAVGALSFTNFKIDTGTAYLAPYATGSLTLDLTILGGAFFDTYACLVLNTKNFALTEYDLELNSVVCFNGKYLGASATKLYELTGDNDDNSPIDWYFETGKIDLAKENINRLRHVWLSYRPNGDLILVVKEENTEYEYPVTSYDITADSVRVKIGKGIKSKYVSLRLENSGYERVFIDRLKLFVEPAAKLR